MSLQSAKMMALFGVMAAMSGMGKNPGMGGHKISLPTKEEIDEKKRQELLSKGYKEYRINGERILALSEKKAQEKYRKLIKNR